MRIQKQWPGQARRFLRREKKIECTLAVSARACAARAKGGALASASFAGRCAKSARFTSADGCLNVRAYRDYARLCLRRDERRSELSTTQFSSQKIYEKLRKKILEFEIYPGTRITETELAAAFKVSRTPVRAALQRLAVEGHIVIQPKQGCFVRPVDIEKISHYYDVRVHLEAAAVELACEHMSDEELDALEEIWSPARARKAINMDEIKSLEEAFHVEIALASRNPVLAEYLEDVNNHIRILRRLGFPDRKSVVETFAEHYELCELIRARNVRSARKAMIEHIRKSQHIARGVTLSQLQNAIRRGTL